MRHPDEGTIHAWLDGALGVEEGARLEAHVATCPQCAEAVAEARGLIAGASRILDALDGVPAGVIPEEPGVVPIRQARGGERRRWLRLTPTRMAAAAVLVAAVGSYYTVTQLGPRTETSVRFERATAAIDSTAARGAGGPSLPQPTPSPMAAQTVRTAPRAEALATPPAAPRTAPLAEPLERRLGDVASKSAATANEQTAAVRDADVPVRARESFAPPTVAPAPVAGRGAGVAGGLARGVAGAAAAADSSSGARSDSISRTRAEAALMAGCYAVVPDGGLGMQSVVVTGAKPDSARIASPSRAIAMVPSRIILDTAPSELSEGARVVTGTLPGGETVRGFWRPTGSGTARVTWLTRERPTLDLTLRADSGRAIVAGDSSLTVRLRRCF